ncbi:scar-like domain-containing protein WAVE 5 isoform X2 [Juglans regia]|uniref:Protein SCAR n=1 Tax=Juglans regia TaxID=51240 RepID=A0A6P9EAX4_JUGRE|nr:scar-like domain-containing protein WAVE 5 isoform X2 [Juglans regia]
MPLVRFELRNEYGLGQPDIYRQIDREDPKAVLDAAAVAGLVGILRQLGDLSEFAAEVFHGLQEQVMTTVSRSHKVRARVERIEAALPPIEKAVLSQTSHIHFAYTAGSEWHPRIRNGKNHFIYNDLPQFIMDSYEECRNPPRLHLLDKFDTGGPGSCFKRYSDPTFFKKASATSDEATTERIRINKNAHRSKKKRSSQWNRKGLRGASRSNSRSRLQFTSLPVNGQTSMQTASAVDVASNSELGDHSNSFDSRNGPQFTSHIGDDQASPQTASAVDMTLKPDTGDHSNSFDSRNGPQFTSHIVDDRASPQTASAVDMTLKPDTGDHSNSFDSRTGLGDIECVFHLSSMEPEQQESLSSRLMQHNDTLDSVFPDEQTKAIDDNFPGSSLLEKIASSSSCVTWDEKAEIVEPNGQQSDREEAPEMLSTKSDLDTHGERAVNLANVDQIDSLLDCKNSLEFIFNGNQINSIESEPVFPDEQTKAMDDNFPGSSLLEKIAYSSYCVTWDEKAEIVVPNGQQSDREEAPEMLSTKSDLDTHGERAVNLANVDQIDSLLDCENSLELIFNGNQINDIESEPDNYMDALNAIGSESENDLDYQTKRKVEQYASNTNDEGINEIHELPENSSDLNHPELESDIASCSFSNEGVPSYIPNSLSPERVVHEQMPQITKMSSNLDFSADDFSGGADAHNGSQLESVVTGPLSSAPKTSDFGDVSMDKMFSSFYKSDETPADFSGVRSISFWTNGGLLGLEPSKPPAYAMSNAVGQDLVNRSKDDTVCPSKHGFMLKGDELEGKLDMLDKKDGGIEKDPSCVCSTSCQDDQEDSISKTKTFGRFSLADSDAKCENFSVMAPKTAVPVSPRIKSISAESNQENDENSSLAFGLSQRLLATGLYKKVSDVHDDNLEPASSMNASGLEQFSGQHRVVNQTIPEKKLEERLGHGSPVDSLTSSPPLEHMKISFHPLNGSETSKLKLNFPDANQCFEGIRDMFPSFQLVPEHSIPMNDFGFESDDDTFCRSSPYMSDDCHSHHSASNSEQWESGETPKSKDPEPHDALCGISSAESISTYQELGRIINNGIHIDCGIRIADTGNGVEPSLSGSLLDLPNFDTVNPVLQQVTNEDSNLLKLECSGQLIPQPPPLPPVQWRVSKPNFYVIEYQQDNVSDALMHASDLKHFGSAMSQQPKPTPEKQQRTNEEAAAIVQMGKQDQQKLNEQKEANRAMNGKEMDERENFLQQIRSKSFSLRRTMTTKPTSTPGPATDFKVTAILEKANAIRQVIGSDRGDDDDTWSDA